MSSGFMLDGIIMNLFTDSTKQTTESHQKFFFKIRDDNIHLYKGYLQCFTWKSKNSDTKRTLRSNNYIEREKLRKCLSGILSIDNDEEDIGKKTNQFISYSSDFNNKYIIQYKNKPISNIPEEPRYISSMTPIGFRNGQYESRCYVNFSFQVLF